MLRWRKYSSTTSWARHWFIC